MGTEALWFGIGVVVTVVLFCIAGILAARRERRVDILTQLGTQVARHIWEASYG